MLHLLLAVSLQSLAAAAEPVIGASAPIRVLLVIRPSDAMPTPTTGMRKEVERIWRSAGVQFTWTDRLPRSEPAVDRVIAIDVRDADPGRDGLPLHALGGVPKVQGRMRQIIYVSPTAVKQLLVTAGVLPLDGQFASTYARTVGRVIAHELGHLLLNASEHRNSGLMRQSFVALDVLSTDASRFALGRDEVVVIHDRVATARRVGDTSGAEVALLEALPRRR